MNSIIIFSLTRYIKNMSTYNKYKGFNEVFYKYNFCLKWCKSRVCLTLTVHLSSGRHILRSLSGTEAQTAQSAWLVPGLPLGRRRPHVVPLCLGSEQGSVMLPTGFLGAVKQAGVPGYHLQCGY